MRTKFRPRQKLLTPEGRYRLDTLKPRRARCSLSRSLRPRHTKATLIPCVSRVRALQEKIALSEINSGPAANYSRWTDDTTLACRGHLLILAGDLKSALPRTTGNRQSKTRRLYRNKIPAFRHTYARRTISRWHARFETATSHQRKSGRPTTPVDPKKADLCPRSLTLRSGLCVDSLQHDTALARRSNDVRRVSLSPLSRRNRQGKGQTGEGLRRKANFMRTTLWALHRLTLRQYRVGLLRPRCPSRIS